jgi:hypothetical protein
MRLRVASSLSNSWAKEPIEAVDSGPALLPMPDRHYANRSLSTAEPVSAPPKWKLENGEQRPAPETLAQRTKMPEIAGQRPAPASVTRGNVAGSHTPGNITPETRLHGCPERIRTFESRDAWRTLGRLALNFRRRKEWTSAAIGASLSPCRDKGRLAPSGILPRRR